MNSTTDNSLSIPPSKKDILLRLFNAGHVTFDELWLLAQDTIVTNYITQPVYQPSYPVTFPLLPISPMYTANATAGVPNQSIH